MSSLCRVDCFRFVLWIFSVPETTVRPSCRSFLPSLSYILCPLINRQIKISSSYAYLCCTRLRNFGFYNWRFLNDYREAVVCLAKVFVQLFLLSFYQKCSGKKIKSQYVWYLWGFSVTCYRFIKLKFVVKLLNNLFINLKIKIC